MAFTRSLLFFLPWGPISPSPSSGSEEIIFRDGFL